MAQTIPFRRRSSPRRTPGKGIPILLLTVGGVALLLPFASRRLADFLWYGELGLERVFLTKVAAQWALGLTFGLLAFAVLYANARVALRWRDPLVEMDRVPIELRPRAAFLARLIDVMTLPVTALLALLVGVVAAADWRTVLQFIYRTPFGQTDPVFGRDIGYYVFQLPLIEAVLGYLVFLLVMSLALVAWPIYLARGEITHQGFRLGVGRLAAPHLAVLAALLLVLEAVRTQFVRIPSLLFSSGSALTGASYTDLHARLPGLRVVMVLALVAAGLILWRVRRGRLARDAAIVLGVWVAALVALTDLVPAAFQRLVVQPNELTREAPQIEHHIRATREAWGLAGVQQRELSGETRLTRADIEANRATIRNVRLWDREPLLQTFGQLQAIRTYYDFVAVDDDRYDVDGEYRQVLLSARELNAAALPTRSFINEHLTFTHGMGVTLGPANQVTEEGLPVLFIKDLPPASSVSVRVTRPQIYFGELSSEFVLAPTRQREFDYPAGEGETAVYSRYDGAGGVPINSFPRRLLFAIRFRSLNVLLSRDLAEDSRILYHRRVDERARKALPFLEFDRDPYLVIAGDGRLVWILDAYTTSQRYPYAQRLSDGTAYMRNSAKVVIDAYDGNLRVFLSDPVDPLIRTFARIYPGIFQPMSAMPPDLLAHIRYPEDLFRAQSALYGTFHMSNPETFYHREDQWQIPGRGRSENPSAFMRHAVMRLPGEPAPEFILMRPFTPRQKDNLAAWMVARNDGEHYGQLVVYSFPRQSLVFGPTQIANRINQDTEIARQISLWDQRGSEVIRGELLVIPIEESLIYVQPLYLRAEGGRIPELKRVIVAHENRVAMEESLEAGLARLFGGAAAAPAPGAMTAAAVEAGAPDAAPRLPTAPPTDAALAELLRRASEHYERAREAQRADDWTRYGEEMRRLGEVLRQLRAAAPDAP